MAAKKPSAKATQAKKSAAKKTVAKKPEPAKKAAPAKKPSAPAARKPAPAPVAAKAALKAPPKAPQTIAVTPPKSTAPKSVKAPAPAQEVAKAVPRVAIPQPPKTPIPARNLAAARGSDADNASGDNEDGDGPDTSSLNLLAGPRNVKPYIPRRGEQYMNKEQLDHFRNILNTWKRDLMQEVDRTVLHMKDEAANFPDPNDRATQESEFSLELRTRDRERKLIRKIEEAIKRIDDGSYGYCVETGEEIGIKRLEARPVATLCVEAQERRERREKQYGDRDDRYR
jgi:DnaK suppressor protein